MKKFAIGTLAAAITLAPAVSAFTAATAQAADFESVPAVSEVVNSAAFDSPRVELPNLDSPHVDVPNFSIVNGEHPKLDIPDIAAPNIDIPNVEFPNFEAPNIDSPNFEPAALNSPGLKSPGFKSPKNDSKVGTEIAKSHARNKVYVETNVNRVIRGKAPLKVDKNLENSAQDWSETMADTGEFKHGEGRFGENIAMDSESPDNFTRQWMKSPGHRANITNGDYTTTGVGVAQDADGNWYGTQRFQ